MTLRQIGFGLALFGACLLSGSAILADSPMWPQPFRVLELIVLLAGAICGLAGIFFGGCMILDDK